MPHNTKTRQLEEMAAFAHELLLENKVPKDEMMRLQARLLAPYERVLSAHGLMRQE